MKKSLLFFCILIRIYFPFDNYILFNSKYKYFYELIYRDKYNLNSITSLLPYEYFVYKIIPENLFVISNIVFDAIIAYLIRDTNYFIGSSFLFPDISSIENFLIVLLIKNNNNELFGTILFLINPHFITFKNYSFSQLISFNYLIYEIIALSCQMNYYPNINAFWFCNLYLFSQYEELIQKIIYYSFFYLISISNQNSFKLYLFVLFKRSTFRNFLLIYLLTDKIQKNRISFAMFYILLVFLNYYILFLFQNTGSGNLNFVNWIQLIFQISFLIERNFKKEEKIKMAAIF